MFRFATQTLHLPAAAITGKEKKSRDSPEFQSRAWQDKRRAFYLSAVGFFTLLLATGWMWRAASWQIEQGARDRFEFKISEVKFAIQQRMMAYEQVLRGSVALFATNPNITRDQWRTYVQQLKLEKNYPGIQAMDYVPKILQEQLPSYLHKVRSDGFPDYEVTPAGEREEYAPVMYIEPFDDWRNKRAFGFDLLTEPARRAALIHDRDTGLPTLTAKIKLMQETDNAVQSGFLMCLPIFDKGETPATIDLRRIKLTGHICSVFRMNDLMRGILGPEKMPSMHMEIYDGKTASPENLMYDNLDETFHERHGQPAFITSQPFELAEHQWTILIKSMPIFDADIDVQKPKVILLSGLLISALFAAIIWSSSLNRRRARELADINQDLKTEIIERSRLEENLKIAKNAAEAANQAKSDFLATVSHELRTPLTLILAPLEQLLSSLEPLKSERRNQLERARRNAQILLNRVNDMLDFSKAEAGKVEAHWEAFDVAAIVAPVMDDAAQVAKKKDCAFNWRVDPVLGDVCLDKQYFERILLNLLSNALKFTPPGGMIAVELSACNENQFELTVADSGIGIATDKLALLFQRFQQVDASITRHYGGTGLGLALVKQLTELMGGSVSVHSEPGHGACFTVRLPRRNEQIDKLAATSANQQIMRHSGQDASLRRTRLGEAVTVAQESCAKVPGRIFADNDNPTVLVVDDNQDLREYIADLLGRDCIVYTAADGGMAWEMLQQYPVDVVVSDVMMPALDGLSLASKIKSSPTLCQVFMILVTARGGSDASVAGLDVGADDYLAKPFAPCELQARVRSALRMRKVQKQLQEQSHEAGRAMIIAGILHNLGNTLNGMTVSSSIMQERLRKSKLPMLQKATRLLQEQELGLPEQVAELPMYLTRLAQHLEAEHEAQLKELTAFRGYVEHACGVIACEQRLGKTEGGWQELLSVSNMLEEAFKLAAAAFNLDNITVERNANYEGAVLADRHKLLQILINLFANAAQALNMRDKPDKRITIRASSDGKRVRLEFHDNGVGIAPENVRFLFNQGFSTRKDGHGYGLHSSANWAREMNGTLSCHSDGVGQGATFILELPVPPQNIQGSDITHDTVKARIV